MSHSVLIVEDDPRLRQTFAEAVRQAQGFSLAGVADDLPPGLELLARMRPDVLLVDIGLPGGSGIELIRRAKAQVPHCEALVVTVFADERSVVACIEAGASGYLLKDSHDADIVHQLRQLCEGGSPISPAIARSLLARLSPRKQPATPATGEGTSLLSTQESRVLTLCAKGYAYDEIAGLLDLSPHTVETYVKRAYRKLQVHSRTEAVYEARKLGLIGD